MTGIHISARKPWGGQPLIRAPVTVELDGSTVATVRWKSTVFVDASPGRHVVTLYYSYLGSAQAGLATMTVDLAANQEMSLQYRSPMYALGRGRITVS